MISLSALIDSGTTIILCLSVASKKTHDVVGTTGLPDLGIQLLGV